MSPPPEAAEAARRFNIGILASYELLLPSMISSVVRSTRAVVMIYYYVAVQALLRRWKLTEVGGDGVAENIRYVSWDRS